MRLILSLFLFLNTMVVQAQSYSIKDESSKLHFVIKNFGLKTGGDISGMRGIIVFNLKNLPSSFFDVSAAVETIDTDIKKRDEHLKKAEYFDAAVFPLIRLVSTKIETGTDEAHFIFYGNLTIKKITRQISFPFTVNKKTGGLIFAGSFEINRTDFGVGGESFSLADKVKITINTFAVLK